MGTYNELREGHRPMGMDVRASLLVVDVIQRVADIPEKCTSSTLVIRSTLCPTCCPPTSRGDPTDSSINPKERDIQPLLDV